MFLEYARKIFDLIRCSLCELLLVLKLIKIMLSRVFGGLRCKGLIVSSSSTPSLLFQY